MVKNRRIKTSVTLSKKVLDKLKEVANKEHRSMSREVEKVLSDFYFNQQSTSEETDETTV
jgi:predicted transcriptional regulator